MDTQILKLTQDTLGKIIKKPPLTEKLLTKPPFRFLHDIMTSVIRTTGFMQGLFTEEEMNSDNVKDKDSKMAFLEKVIDIVSLVNGKQLNVKPSKIVAGHEAEKTNMLLQSLAESINKKINSDPYVQKILGKHQNGHDASIDKHTTEKSKKDEIGETHITEQNTEKNKQEFIEQEKNNEKRDDIREDKREEKKEDQKRERRHRQKKTDKEENTSIPKKEHPGSDGDAVESRVQADEKEEVHRSRKHKKERDSADGRREQKTSPTKEHVQGKEETVITNGDQKQDGSTLHKIERPSSAKGSRRRRDGRLSGRLPDDENAEELVAQQLQQEAEVQKEEKSPTLDQRLLVRPSSARPAPPHVKKPDIIPVEAALRLGSGRPAPVIVDEQSDNEDEFFLVDEVKQSLPHEIKEENNDSEEDHGGLVKKILETKKELEGGNQSPTRKTEIERVKITDAAHRKEREMIQKDVEKLRACIQSFTRSANPLGKVMDYVQEDLDSMQAELREWVAENRRHALELTREKGITDKAIEPLKSQLTELDVTIADQLNKIITVKSNIHANDVKIDKMLRGISKS